MRAFAVAVTSVCCLLLTGETPDAYQGPDYLKLKAFLPPAPGAALCFARTYDPEHLNQHRQQRVTGLVPHASGFQAVRSSTATKNPSVPWLAGVIRSVSAEPSAEGSGATGMAASHSCRQGTSLKSACRARKAST
jgi:hypothetical protein